MDLLEECLCFLLAVDWWIVMGFGTCWDFRGDGDIGRVGYALGSNLQQEGASGSKVIKGCWLRMLLPVVALWPYPIVVGDE